jgi:integrase
MPRTTEHTDKELGSRTARQRLPIRRNPYFASLDIGLSIGYRRMESGGNWIARRVDAAKAGAKGSKRYVEEKIGAANDALEHVGMSFQEAKDAAKAWNRREGLAEVAGVAKGAYLVRQLMADYLKDRQRVKRKPLKDLQSTISAHVLPMLGDMDAKKLQQGQIETWRDAIADGSPLVRVKKGEAPATRTVDMSDEETQRKRQATANRIFSVLQAALNYAYKRKRIASATAWDKIDPFRQVDAPKVRYLTVEEAKRLIEVCPDDFKRLVQAVVYTGIRYGEACAMKVNAFDPQSRSLHIPKSKSGKPRNIALTDEGTAFFASVTEGQQDDAFMFTHRTGRNEGEPWLNTQQRYWMMKLCKEANIAPVIGFHILRHTYASLLAMNKTEMKVISIQLGHADTRMTEKHYAHLSDSYVADTVRANLPSFGLSVS